MRLAIQFGPSNSPLIAQAARLARKLPGYRSTKSGRHHVRLTATGRTWQAVYELWGMVGHLGMTRCTIDGKPWNFHRWMSLAATFGCLDLREKAPSGDQYCVGKNSPTDDPAFFGCRLARGVRLTYDAQPGLDAVVEWWKFGTLDPDWKSFLVDKEEILRVIEAKSTDVAKACPAWSMDRVQAVVRHLPGVLVIGDEWKLRYSELDPARAIGVQPAYPVMGATIQLGELGGGPVDTEDS